MLKALRHLWLLAVLGITPAAAQDHFFPTPGNAIVPGYVTMCIVANQAVPCTPASGSSIISGTTPTTGCGAQGVLFSNGGVVGCDTAFTYAGAGGALKVPNAISNTAGNIVITSAGEIREIGGTIRLNADTIFFNNTAQTAVMGMLTAVTGVGTNGVIAWVDNTGAAFPGRMGFGGFTAAFPAIARNGTQMRIVLADGTAAAPLSAGVISASLASATGTNAVCNTPGTETALTVQVWATGCAASSARFKEGIASIDRVKALDDVMRFDPVSYTYKPEFNMGSDKHVGFTAEQIGKVDPQWITYEDDGVTPHAVKYNEMVPLLVAAIHQLKAEIEALKARR